MIMIDIMVVTTVEEDLTNLTTLEHTRTSKIRLAAS